MTKEEMLNNFSDYCRLNSQGVLDLLKSHEPFYVLFVREKLILKTKKFKIKGEHYWMDQLFDHQEDFDWVALLRVNHTTTALTGRGNPYSEDSILPRLEGIVNAIPEGWHLRETLGVHLPPEEAAKF